MIRLVRTTTAALALATLAACGGGEPAAPKADPTKPTEKVAPAAIRVGSGAPVIGDVPLGAENAPVTLIEYAALTCHVCRDFARQVMPRIKSTYIDTGKVRYVYRDFPLEFDEATLKAIDGPGVLLSAVARCKGPEKFHDLIDTTFRRQADFIDAARAGQAQPIITGIAQAHGMTWDEAKACIDNKELSTSIKASRDEGAGAGVTGTPGIFVNGEQFSGMPNWENVSAMIEKKLAEAAGGTVAPATAPATPADAPAPPPATAPTVPPTPPS
jgi:protein-disulfide isomerase